jgi:hypothetical protein
VHKSGDTAVRAAPLDKGTNIGQKVLLKTLHGVSQPEIYGGIILVAVGKHLEPLRDDIYAIPPPLPHPISESSSTTRHPCPARLLT